MTAWRLVRMNMVIKSANVLIAALVFSACSATPMLTISDARAAYARGNYSAAQKALREASALSPDNVEIMLLNAHVSLAQGAGDIALAAIESAARLGVSSAQLAPLRAEALALHGKSDAALAVPLKKRDAAIFHYVRGLAFLKADNVIEARTELTQAQTLAPRNPRVAISLARLLYRLSLFDEAMAMAKHAISLAPQNIVPHLLVADIERWRARTPSALAAYSRVIALEPQNIEALMGQAESYYLLGRYKNATETLDRIAEQSPSNTEMFKIRAKVAVRLGQSDKALDALASVGGAFADDAETQSIAGDIALSRDVAWTAVTHYEKAVQLRPDLPKYRANLINALIKTGQAGAADGAIASIPPQFANDPQLSAMIRKAQAGQPKQVNPPSQFSQK